MTTKPITTTLAVLALAGLLGACSGSGGSGGGDDDVASVSGDDNSDEQAQDDEADAEEELLDWVECMRDEGIDIPDPTRDADGNLVIEGPGIGIGGGGSQGTSNSDEGEGDEPPVDPDEMNAAMEACGQPPALGPSDISEEDQQARQEAALEFADCMRDHGIEDFPDPDFSDTGPGGEPQQRELGDDGGDSGSDQGSRLVLGPFGEIDLDDPEVAAAFEACQDVLGGPELPSDPTGPGSDAGSET